MQPAKQADEAERVGDGAVAVGHRVERRIGPVQRVGSTGEGLRQAPLAMADRGERGAGGEAGRAQREVERMDPGVGMREPAGGLGGGHAGAQALAHRIGCCGGAGVEPGERVGGVAQRDEQAGQRSAGQPGVRAGRRCLADRRPGAPDAAPVGVGFVRGVLPGRAQQVRIIVDVAERAFSRHRCVSPGHWYHWVSMTGPRRIRARSIRALRGFSPARGEPVHGRVRIGKKRSVR